MSKKTHDEKNIDTPTIEEKSWIKAEVHLMTGELYNVEFPSSTTAEELINALLEKLGLPKQDTFGQPPRYRLMLRTNQGTVTLRQKDTIGGLTLEANPKLYLVPEMTAG